MSSSANLFGTGSAAAATAASDIISQSEVEKLLAQVESQDVSAPGGSALTGEGGGGDGIRRHEFPKLTLISSGDLRPLRMRHEDFIASLATRLSLHLGLEVGLQLTKLEVLPFQQFVDGLAAPTYVTLLKLQPLAGICLLDLPPKLGLCIIDRILGGPGGAPEEIPPLGKIESRLLTPIVTQIINEWCSTWRDMMEIQPTVLGTETNTRYLRTSTPAASMLVVGMEMRMAELAAPLQLAFPHSMLEPLTFKLNAGAADPQKPGAAAKTGPVKWNPLFNDLQIQVTAESSEFELPAGKLAELKPGDILGLPPHWMNQVRLCLANHPGFVGTLGLSDQLRAVKIEKCLKG
jgi:flagellar motor switch protein FliM